MKYRIDRLHCKSITLTISLNPRISIIIPCFNQAHFLGDAVNSVLNSDYSNIEIIIINDGSTDNSKEKAEEFCARHQNIIFIDQQNKGVSYARNAGIKIATGKYILPLDGDDMISPEYIPGAIKVLEENPNVKVVYCKALKFNENREWSWRLKQFSLQSLAKDNMIFVSAVFRKSDWKVIGGYSEDLIKGHEDWEFWIKLLKSGGEVTKLPFVGFYYRITGESRRKAYSKVSKKNTVDYINKNHREFAYQYLNGPLRYQRSTSKFINTMMKWLSSLPLFLTVIYSSIL